MSIIINGTEHYEGLVMSHTTRYNSSMSYDIVSAYVYNPASDMVEQIYDVDGQHLEAYMIHPDLLPEYRAIMSHKVYHGAYEYDIQCQLKEFEHPQLERGVRVQFVSPYKPRNGEAVPSGTYARVFFIGDSKFNRFEKTLGLGFDGDIDANGKYNRVIFVASSKVVTVPDADAQFVPDVENAREYALRCVSSDHSLANIMLSLQKETKVSA